ncbi:hypothetical protein Pmani_038558 [Petrolisthes manimaculis]|uniref:G-protein coupled receptors family 1 profile domain-containing protein n=1 Tax=Petrolisthes manimaculis TaxID=1843537 RepID=A0AAE1NF02_9EUCA|nr:hypothetical protein Pmani_038558 [Petrolisthes manimaculis]
MSSGVTSSPGDLVLAWVTRSGGVGSDNDLLPLLHPQANPRNDTLLATTDINGGGNIGGKTGGMAGIGGKGIGVSTEGDLLLGTSQGVLMGTEGALGSSGEGLDGYTEQEHWNRLGMLLVVSSLSALGTLGNIFAIAAVMTEEHLKKKGNVLVVNVMLAGLVVTAGVLPAWVVALLAGWPSPSPEHCPSWLLTALAAHTALLTLPALAWENSARVAGRSVGVGVLATFVGVSWAAAGAVTVTQWVTGLAPPHCASTPAPAAAHTAFTSAVGVTLVGVPLVAALLIHAHTLLSGRGGARRHLPPTVKPPQALARDLALTATNLVVAAVAGSCWAAGVAGDWWANSTLRPGAAWLPVTAATTASFLYAAHKPFREAYIQLFHYCCCKTSVSLSRRGRSGEAAAAAAAAMAAAARPASDVRVHIIPGYNMYTTASSREHRPPSHTHTPKHHVVRKQEGPNTIIPNTMLRKMCMNSSDGDDDIHY